MATCSDVDAAKGWKFPEGRGLDWLLVGLKTTLDIFPKFWIPASNVEDAEPDDAVRKVVSSEGSW